MPILLPNVTAQPRAEREDRFLRTTGPDRTAARRGKPQAQ